MDQLPYGSQVPLSAIQGMHAFPNNASSQNNMRGIPFGMRATAGDVSRSFNSTNFSVHQQQSYSLSHQQPYQLQQLQQQQQQQLIYPYGQQSSAASLAQAQKPSQTLMSQSSYQLPQQQQQQQQSPQRHSFHPQQQLLMHQQQQSHMAGGTGAFGQQVRFGQQATILAPIRSIVPTQNSLPATAPAALPISRKTLACLALADHALKHNQIVFGLRCLHAALITKEMPLRMTAQTCLNIAKISWRYLHNAPYAKSAVQEALKISQSMVRQSASMTQSSYGPVLELEATLLLCRILISERSYTRALQLLNGALDTAKNVAAVAHNNQQWYCQIKSQQIIIHMKSNDLTNALDAIKAVSDHCMHNKLPFLQILFSLARAQTSVQSKRFDVALGEISECHALIDNTAQQQPGSLHPILREELRCYGNMLSVLVYLSFGKLKTGKPYLEQMEKCVNTLEALKGTSPDAAANAGSGPLVRRYAEAFQFIDDDLFLPLYFAVVAQYHLKNGFASHTDRYAEEAMNLFCPNLTTMLTENRDKQQLSGGGAVAIFKPLGTAHDWPLRNSNGLDLRIHLHSLLATARLLLSRSSTALDDVAAIVRIAQRNVHGGVGSGLLPLSDDMQAKVHCMLAMITMSLNFNEVAESQLNAALRTCNDHEWWLYMSLTLAIVYLRSAKFHDFVNLAHTRLKPESNPTQCLLLRNSVNTIQSALAFVEGRMDDARAFLTEGIAKSAHEESIMRMIAVSLCQLGWYCVQMQNRDEALQAANRSYSLATQFPDLNLQFWALSLMRDVFRATGDYHQEEQCSGYVKTLTEFVNKEFESLSAKPEYKLLEWLDGPTPPSLLTLQQQQQVYVESSVRN